MTDHSKSKESSKKTHKESDAHSHPKKTTAHASHKKTHAHHKAEAKQPVIAQPDQTATIVTTAVITAILVLAVFFVFQLITGSAPATGSGSNTGTNYAVGADGALVITEWSDFECPFCARALPSVRQIKETYGDAVIIEYKHFPLSFHPNAQKAAEASECARDQGKFWEYHDILFANQQSLTVPSLKSYAVDLGLDASTFNTCLDSSEKAGVVAQHMKEGSDFGVTGTPTFDVGGQKIVGAQPFSAFKTAIDKALAEGNTGYVAPEAKEDPVIQMTVIEDSDCAVCDTTQVISYTQTDLFPTVQITTLQKEDAQAQDLINELGLNALPAYIFDDEVVNGANYAQVSQAFLQVGDKYVINPSATGNVKLLNPPNVEGRPVKGSADAPVTIIEWSDFECPFCERFYSDAYQKIVDTYVASGDVKIVFMNFPLSFHSNAENAALAAECAFEQNMFWEYHDVLFANQNALSESALKGYASGLGLDTAAFNSCFDSRDAVADINAQMALGQSVGVSGTPGFLVNGISVSGAQPFEAFESLIEAELGN